MFLLFSEKVYSVVAFMEEGKEKKSIFPSIWMDWENNVVRYPPKGKSVCTYIAKWLLPSSTWQSFKVTKSLKEFGDKDNCSAFLRSHMDSESDRSFAG